MQVPLSLIIRIANAHLPGAQEVRRLQRPLIQRPSCSLLAWHLGFQTCICPIFLEYHKIKQAVPVVMFLLFRCSLHHLQQICTLALQDLSKTSSFWLIKTTSSCKTTFALLDEVLEASLQGVVHFFCRRTRSYVCPPSSNRSGMTCSMSSTIFLVLLVPDTSRS